MIIKMYSVYDRKALNYNPPFYASTDAAAVRIITDTLLDTNTSLARHPNDYVLYCVGEFNDQSGGLGPFSPLQHVIDVAACVPHTADLDLFNGGKRPDTLSEKVTN